MERRVFVLTGVHHQPEFRVTLLTDEKVTNAAVVAAWSSAVRYSAKGYDVPDYEAAIARMLAKHPTWKIFTESIATIQYDPAKADEEK